MVAVGVVVAVVVGVAVGVVVAVAVVVVVAVAVVVVVAVAVVVHMTDQPKKTPREIATSCLTEWIGFAEQRFAIEQAIATERVEVEQLRKNVQHWMEEAFKFRDENKLLIDLIKEASQLLIEDAFENWDEAVFILQGAIAYQKESESKLR